MKLKLLIPLTMIFSIRGYAQSGKIYQHYEQIWVQFYNQVRMNDKWGFSVDAGYRTKDDLVHGTSTVLARIGGIYYLNKNTRLMGGYAFFNAYPLEANIDIAQPEHRLWQQVQFQQEYSKLTLTNTVRFEQRWRKKIIPPDQYADEYNFNYRLRFGFSLQYPLLGKKNVAGDLSLLGGDEVMLNFGKQIVYNFLDQNRIYGGLRYYFSPGNNLTVLYMNSFTETGLPALYRIFNVIRFSYYHNIDLRKGSSTKIR